MNPFNRLVFRRIFETIPITSSLLVVIIAVLAVMLLARLVGS